jgi:hypothetical protein
MRGRQCDFTILYTLCVVIITKMMYLFQLNLHVPSAAEYSKYSRIMKGTLFTFKELNVLD